MSCGFTCLFNIVWFWFIGLFAGCVNCCLVYVCVYFKVCLALGIVGVLICFWLMVIVGYYCLV